MNNPDNDSNKNFVMNDRETSENTFDHYDNKTYEAKHMVEDKYWNGVSFVKSTWSGKIKDAISYFERNGRKIKKLLLKKNGLIHTQKKVYILLI